MDEEESVEAGGDSDNDSLPSEFDEDEKLDRPQAGQKRNYQQAQGGGSGY